MVKNQATISIQEVENVRTECESLLTKIKAFSQPDEDKEDIYPDTFRLIATPMLYSVWERCFTICHAVALRLIRDTTTTVSALDAPLRTVWLLRSPFYTSLVDQLKNSGRALEGADFQKTIKKRRQKGEFSTLCEFLSEFDKWLNTPLDETIDTDDLVMTFSNVNPDVVELNARSIGIDHFEKFKALKLGRLHDLVGRRNGIGHGAIIDAPSNSEFTDLLKFTEDLVKDYCSVFIEWMQTWV